MAYITIDIFGTKEYLNDDHYLHREDGPAIIFTKGNRWWKINGKFHNENSPAVREANGGIFWYLYDKPHCVNGPYVDHPSGFKRWAIDGKKIWPKLS